MIKKRVANLFGSRAAKERARDQPGHLADWATGPSEVEPPRKSISKVSNEAFESKLDELDRVFAQETVPVRPHGQAPFDLEAFSPDEEPVDPRAFRESLPPDPPPLAPPAPQVQRPVDPPRARGRRDTILPWPAPAQPVEEPKAVPLAPIVTQAIPAWPPVPVDRPSAPPAAAPAPAPPTPVRLDVPQPAKPEAPAEPLVAGLRSKQDIVNAFKNLLAAERSEAEAKARLVPGGNSTVAEITLPKSINPTTLRLKLEPRTDAEGRTVLSITVE